MGNSQILTLGDNDEVVYRWHNGDDKVKQIGRFVTSEKFEDATVAKRSLALPTDNHQTYLDALTLKKGTVVFEGQVAPNFDLPGGGKQLFITGDINQAAKFLERLK